MVHCKNTYAAAQFSGRIKTDGRLALGFTRFDSITKVDWSN